VLFRDALEKSGKVAVAKVALRQREALAALRVREGVITLETLLWPDEVRKPDFAFLDEDIEVRSQELKMAASLIETMTEDFDPDQYHDTYREALEAVVQAKVEGNDVVRPAGVEARAQDPARRPDRDPAGQRRRPKEEPSAKRAKPRDPPRAPNQTQEEAKPAKPRTREDPRPARPAHARARKAREPIPHWPGELVSLGDYQVYVRSVPAEDAETTEPEPALCVHGLEGSSRNWTDLMDLLRPGWPATRSTCPASVTPRPAPDGRYSIAALAQTSPR
jgi:hypothetical protein